MIDNNFCKNIMMRDKSDLCSLAAILDWKIVAIKTLVIATGLPTWFIILRNKKVSVTKKGFSKMHLIYC